MILRFAASLSLLLGVAALLGFLTLAGRGPFASPEARHMSALKSRLAPPRRVAPISFAALAALPRHRPLGEYAPLEERGVSLEGHVQGMIYSIDGDIHLEVGEDEVSPASPSPIYATAEITPRWRAGSEAWTYERLVAAFRPVDAGFERWDRPPRRVRLTGWLLYDFQYDPLPESPLGRLTGWEVHPVTRIELWDDARQAFVDYPR